MDNIITVYDAGRRFGQRHKKKFRGWWMGVCSCRRKFKSIIIVKPFCAGAIFSGYAVQPSFSPNGQFLTCGDGEGQLWFWDYRTTKVRGERPCQAKRHTHSYDLYICFRCTENSVHTKMDLQLSASGIPTIQAVWCRVAGMA